MVEMKGVDQNIELRLFSAIKGLVKTNLIEDNGQNTGQGGNIFNLNIGKNSIETFKFK